MARVNAPLLAFNRGEVSKVALARIDVEKLRLAADCQLNFEPKVAGSMALAPGLEFIGDTHTDDPALLLPFVFAKDDTALIELTDSLMRIWIDDALVKRVAVSTEVLNSSFDADTNWDSTDSTSGATVTIADNLCTLTCTPIGGLARVKQDISVASADFNKEHGLRIVVDNGPVTVRAGSVDGLADLIAQTVLDTGTHALALTPVSDIFLQIESTDARDKIISSVSIDGAGTLQVPTPWTADDLSSLRATQSGDIIFVAAYGIQQYKIERRSTHGWSVVQYRSNNGPFNPGPTVAASLSPSDYYGNATLTANRPVFQSGHVGCLFRLFSNGQFYKSVLGAANAFTPPVRVVGVGVAARNYSWTVSGSFSGTVTLQRSFDGPDSGFSDVDDVAAAGTISSSTGTTSATPDLDNAIVWERVGFKGGDYTSGSATVVSNYSGGGGFAIVRVTAVNSSISADIEILVPFSSLVATSDWSEAQWSTAAGFPSAVGFVEGRLAWAGRDTMWFSQSNDYTGFAEIDLQGNALGDAAAIVETFGEGPVDRVNFMLPLSRPLFGREMSIAAARSSSFDEPLTPTNFSVKDCATQGAARLPALKIDKRGIFVAGSGRVYELAFDAQALDYSAHNLTRLNEDIYAPGLLAGSVARQPDTAVYLPRSEGQCAVLLYDPDDEVVGWWRRQTLGKFESVCVLPPGDGEVEDRVYFVVKRNVDGTARRFLERLAPRADCKGGLINKLLDSYLVHDGSAVTSITLAHLPNTAVEIWADGVSLGTVTTDGSGVATLPGSVTASKIVAGLGGAMKTATGSSLTQITGLSAYEGLPAEVFADQQPSGRMVRLGTFAVSGGAIALPNGVTASSIVAFLGYVAPFMSARLAYGAQLGSPLAQRKKIDHLGLVLYDTHATGLKYGQRMDRLDDLPLVEDGGVVDASSVWSEYEQPVTELAGEWSADARLCLLAQAPFPVTIAGLTVEMKTNER